MKTNTWSCDGIAKNGQEYPNCSGPHPPYENYGTDCIVCGLPREAQQPQKTMISTRGSKSPLLIVSALFSIGFLLAIAVTFGAYKLLEAGKGSEPIAKTSNTPLNTHKHSSSPSNTDPRAFVSATATNPQLISQGEKILLTSLTNLPKTQGATAFAQKHWDSAIARYQQATATNPYDPESKIYLSNAKAEKAGNPLTMAVDIPITPNPDASQEVLRGVALAQDQFNHVASAAKGRLLQIVLVNQAQAGIPDLAQDLIKSPNVLGVIEQGIDNDSRANANLYQQAGLAVISPVSTSVSPGTANQSMLKTIPASQKANELAEAYLQQASTTLAKYANQKQSPVATTIFYDSSSSYSQEMKGEFTAALGQIHGNVVKEVDINSPNFNPRAEIKSAEAAGAKTAFLAIGRNKVEQAVAIAQANIASGAQPLQLIGGDQLYEPNLLIEGGDAIKGIVLAVPWSWQPNDPFAARSASVWKGRVSWRTATAHDATAALASVLSKQPTRSGVVQQFNQGVTLPAGTATNFSVFNQIPLVQAVKGSNGPQGSNYEFDPI